MEIFRQKFNTPLNNIKKDETDNCYLIWGEDGYLKCTYDHKPGEKCLAINT